jgi:hypothetical protein
MAKCIQSGTEYAIKLFASRHGFEAEKALYSSDSAQGGPFAQFLPKVRTSVMHMRAHLCLDMAMTNRSLIGKRFKSVDVKALSSLKATAAACVRAGMISVAFLLD